MINTYAAFYYIDEVTAENNYIDFDEGASEISFQIPNGSYTLTTFGQALQDGLNENGALTYVVTLNRSTRKYTISAGSAFTLRVTTGSHAGSAAWALVGFTSNQTGSSSYTSQNAVGTSYEPQFWLQDFIHPDDWVESIDATVNQSASGQVEVVKFGTVNFTQFNITYVNDYYRPSGGYLSYDPNAVSNLRAFMNFLISKNELEFLPDKESPNSYYTVLLESTPQSDKGTGFKIREMYDRDLVGWYETGVLKFRIIV